MYSVSEDDEVLGLRERKVGLGIAGDVGKYLKVKAKKFLNKQVGEIAEDITKNNATLPQALSNKLAKVKRRIKRVGGSIRKRKRIVKRKKPVKRSCGPKKVKRRTVRRKKAGKKRNCYKGTIFARK